MHSAADNPVEARPAWLIPALGALGLLAVVVIFLLPNWVSGPPVKTAPTIQQSADTQSTPGPTKARDEDEGSSGAAASPFADAVAAKARAEAQELLAELIDVQENLRERGAESWAADAMVDIAAEALAGDEQYREREFETAIGHYEQALSDALALEASLPERFSVEIQTATDAIEALDGEAAATALALAEMLEPGEPAITELGQRLEILPTVAGAVASAVQAEEASDLESALASLQEAAKVDTAHLYVKAEVSRVADALNELRFNTAMSEGYAALDTSNFDRAQQRFSRAAKLQAGSAEAAAALQELSVARTAAKLGNLQTQGERARSDEDWAAAITAYEAAAKIDPSLRFVREGLAFVRPRAQLDKELQEILDKPERLVDDAILRESRMTLDKTRALDDLGPRLTDKADAVSKTLSIASTPLKVRLQSDGLTEVTVYKIARLGTLSEKELSLRPGKYTAVGTRRGYRDVRVEFQVAPDERAPVYIACNETI